MMFRAEPWAEAFLRAVAPPDGAEALEVLRVYCIAGLLVPGELSGLGDAERFCRIIDSARKKCGADTPSADIALIARNFFLLMVRKGCFHQYKKITVQIQKLINARKGIAEAVLETPFEPDAGFIDAVKNDLLKKTGAKEIHIIPRLVPALIGGLRIRMDGVLFDGSLEARLKRMAADLRSYNGTVQ
jgi:F-type H+-transporting ATPase subunit delta